MNYTVKSVLIICAVAVVSFFAASALIPEKNAVAPVKKAASNRGVAAALGVVGIPVAEAGGAPVENPIMASGVGAPAMMPAEVSAPNKAGVAAAAPPLPPRAAHFNTKAAPPNTQAVRLDPKAGPVIETKVAPPPPPARATPAPATFTAAAVTPPPDTAKKKRINPAAPLGYKLAKTAVCAAVENRAPAGVADKFSKEAGAVYYFTHIVGAADTASAVMHRWYREGKLIQTSILRIRSPNWRTHSKRNLATVDEPTGNWRVDAVDLETGKVLESASFVVE